MTSFPAIFAHVTFEGLHTAKGMLDIHAVFSPHKR
jgi:hypothetical protein